MNLPNEFTDRMQLILDSGFEDFLKSYGETRRYGLRLNTLKISSEEFEKLSHFHLRPVEWIPNAYYYAQEDKASRHPYYKAGLYYLQEPSAMTPASVLDVQPGMRVLDLCAAPGGKSTALGAKLKGRGLLVANDISAARCRALLHNLETFGVSNILVANTSPDRLAARFPQYFDRVLVDAPCSGEGMFRKDEDAVKAWSPAKVAQCAKIQREIILQAADMLRPGGRLLYSTCTFAPEEDEETIEFLLAERPEMKLFEIPARPGFSRGLIRWPHTGERETAAHSPALVKCVRLWPHKTGGEGHFLALLGKEGADVSISLAADASGQAETAAGMDFALAVNPDGRSEKRKKRKAGKRKAGREQSMADLGKIVPDRVQMQILSDFFVSFRFELPAERIRLQGTQVFLEPEDELPDLTGIPYLRRGLLLGELKKDRFEPSQALAMALCAKDAPCVLNLSAEDERLDRYLRGETLQIAAADLAAADQDRETGEKQAAGRTANSVKKIKKTAGGWCLVCVDGYPLGWGKVTGSILKNKLHPGWRLN